MTTIHRGIIEDFRGSWGSGIATLIVSGRAIPCDNAPTVRALRAAFGDCVIGEGHTVSQSAFIGKDIIWVWDMGLVLGGFVPTEDFEARGHPIPGIGLYYHHKHVEVFRRAVRNYLTRRFIRA